MPIFAFEFALFLYLGLQVGRTALKKEPHFSAHAEVGHDEDGEFTEE